VWTLSDESQLGIDEILATNLIIVEVPAEAFKRPDRGPQCGFIECFIDHSPTRLSPKCKHEQRDQNCAYCRLY